MNDTKPRRRTGELRKGRVSLAGARYFVTACTVKRRPVLGDPPVAAITQATMLRLLQDGDVEWLAGSTMPDHVHLLFALGDRLSLDRVLAKFKGIVSREVNRLGRNRIVPDDGAAPLLRARRNPEDGMDQRSSPTTAIWQENVFEHRLRADENPEDYALYIYMNPYRAMLAGLDQAWPWWICTEPKRFRFLDALAPGCLPQSEWLQSSEGIATRIIAGE